MSAFMGHFDPIRMAKSGLVTYMVTVKMISMLVMSYQYGAIISGSMTTANFGDTGVGADSNAQPLHEYYRLSIN